MTSETTTNQPCTPAEPQVTLTAGQKQALQQITDFLQSPGSGIFILKGYAGTGKTTLIKLLAQQLQQQQQQFALLAPTGRAAAVIRSKSGFDANTIHGELYTFHGVDGEPDPDLTDPQPDDFGQMRLLFTMRLPEAAEYEEKVYIIDEASMVSDEPAVDTSFAEFGSGHTLSDLLHAAGTNKIIFVGDPCQLPPVGAAYSPALDAAYLRSRGKTVQEFELKEIVRQAEGSAVLQLAHRIRRQTQQTHFEKWIKIKARDIPAVACTSYQAQLQYYLSKLQHGQPQDVIAICHSNKECLQINRQVRRHLLGSADAPLQEGDLLIITQNNYKVPLANGDFVLVRYVDPHIQMYCGLQFCNVTVEDLHTGQQHNALMCLNTLYSGSPNITHQQQRSLMIAFSKKMRAQQIKPRTIRYREELQNDPYLNSLRANYGYAVTCHKSQGGEWEQVFLFLNKGMYVMPGPMLTRWWYTAVTRAKNQLVLTDDWWLV
ncbi:MAG: ATP-dependent RecD-like DNA helicase [Lacibacter sp.]